jgi:mannonate dehydratase
MEVTRRVFSSAAIAAAFAPVGKTRPLEPLSAGIKTSMQVDEHVTDDDLAWIKQMGVDYLNVQTGKGRATLENFLAIRKRVEAAGLKVWNIPNNDNRNIEEITLNLRGRDQKIDWLKQYIRDTGKACIGYITYAHMANGIWSSKSETTRGGGESRAFHLATAKGYWNGKTYEGPLTHGRQYSKEELWENYTYFIRQIAPVAEQAGVRIGIHPDDDISLEPSMDMCARSRLRTRQILESVCAAGLGQKEEITPARTFMKRRGPSPKWASSGKSISGT